MKKCTFQDSHLMSALQICAALWEWCINQETFVTNLGDWCLTGTGLQASAPGNKFHYVSRASDYMLTHFKLFSEVSCFSTPSFCTQICLLGSPASASQQCPCPIHSCHNDCMPLIPARLPTRLESALLGTQHSLIDGVSAHRYRLYVEATHVRVGRAQFHHLLDVMTWYGCWHDIHILESALLWVPADS